MNRQETEKLGILIGEMQGLKKQVSSVAEIVQKLPCQEHSVRIKLLEKGRNNNTTECQLNKSIRGNIRAQIYGGLIGAGITGIIWLAYTVLSH